MSGTSEEKTDPASQRKLSKQREKGVVPQAGEAAAFISQSLGVFVLFSTLPMAFGAFNLAFDSAFESFRSQDLAYLAVVAKPASELYLYSILPVLGIVMACAVVIKLIFQKGFVFSLDPIAPKASRLDPAASFKRIFGMRGWIELARAFSGLVIWAGVFYVIVNSRLDVLLASMVCGLTCTFDIAIWLAVALGVAALLLFLCSALVDGLLQKFLFSNEMKMTKSEVKQERKDQFGSPEVRRARKKMQREMEKEAENTGIDNATMAMFYGNMAVGIRYHPKLAPTPMLAVKADDPKQSLAIRNQIRENGYLETEHRSFVENMMNCAVGKPVPKEFHDDLREALYAMFS